MASPDKAKESIRLEKTEASVDHMVGLVAAKQGWVPNPDRDFRERIQKGLLVNYQRYGYFMCPCRDGDGDRQADKDICCPCAYAKADIAEYGHCFCGLYLSRVHAAENLSVNQIPERRGS